jgi:hypothetical protein
MESVYRTDRVKSESNEDQVHANPITQTALDYAARGIPVFPLKGKVPLTKHGFKDASADPGEVVRMFDPEVNATGIGMPTGSVYIVVDKDGASEEARRIWSSLPPTLEVATARGIHRYYRAPEGVAVKSRKLAPDLDLKADGGYVLTPGSLHPSGIRYAVVEETKAYGVAELPAHLLEAETAGRPANSGPGNYSPRFIDDGAPIPDGSRNKTLASIAGGLHDGTRNLDQLSSDLMAVNLQRCQPPLESVEVERIAASIHRKTPCRPTPRSAPEVLEVVQRLRDAASRRAVKGMRGATGWSVYYAGLDLLTKYGQMHPDGVAMDVDLRTWSLNAGTSASTVSRVIKRTPLVRYEKKGRGRSRSRVVFVSPTGVQVQHLSTGGDSQESETSSSVAARPLFRTLYRLRWGASRINKSRAAILAAVVECPTSIKRSELAERLGRKPDSLKKPLAWLVDNGLLIHTGYGRYAAPEDLERRIEDARELAGEPLADRLQMQRHERQRESYRKRNRKDRTPDEATGPTEEGRTNVQRSREAREAYEPPPAKPTDEQAKRIAELVRQGMRRDFAEEAVLGGVKPTAHPGRHSTHSRPKGGDRGLRNS